jgi:hypothetical protein
MVSEEYHGFNYISHCPHDNLLTHHFGNMCFALLIAWLSSFFAVITSSWNSGKIMTTAWKSTLHSYSLTAAYKMTVFIRSITLKIFPSSKMPLRPQFLQFTTCFATYHRYRLYSHSVSLFFANITLHHLNNAFPIAYTPRSVLFTPNTRSVLIVYNETLFITWDMMISTFTEQLISSFIVYPTCHRVRRKR